MLRFVPKTAEELGLDADGTSNIFGYIGYDLSCNKECGKCLFSLNGYNMSIDSVISDYNAETIEGFIRSALNYGANRGAYIAEFKAEKGIDVALLLGFKNNDGKLVGEIPELLAGSCCKNNK